MSTSFIREVRVSGSSNKNLRKGSIYTEISLSLILSRFVSEIVSIRQLTDEPQLTNHNYSLPTSKPDMIMGFNPSEIDVRHRDGLPPIRQWKSLDKLDGL